MNFHTWNDQRFTSMENSRMKLLIYLHCFQNFGQLKTLTSTVYHPECSAQWPQSSFQRPMSRAHCPQSSFQHPQRPESSVMSPLSRVQDPKTSVQSQASRIQSPASSVQSSASNTCVQSPEIPVCRNYVIKWYKTNKLTKNKAINCI